jgi:IS30 family transposase
MAKRHPEFLPLVRCYERSALVERHSRFTTLIKVPNSETVTVITALTKQIRRLPASLRRSLTWDRGHEMAKHAEFTLATNEG